MLPIIFVFEQFEQFLAVCYRLNSVNSFILVSRIRKISYDFSLTKTVLFWLLIFPEPWLLIHSICWFFNPVGFVEES